MSASVRLTMLTVVAGLVVAALPARRADGADFFRVSSTGETAITSFSGGGWMAWSNAQIGVTCTVEACADLVDGDWQPYVATAVTSIMSRARVCDFDSPPGMVMIPAGWFDMGNTFGTNEPGTAICESPLHSVYVSVFYISTHEVTGALWAEVADWAVGQGYQFSAGAGNAKGSDHPAVSNSWYDCVKWCNARSEKEALTPCYYTSSAHSSNTVYRSGAVNVEPTWVNWGANGYRLPTDAEWEKAARGGPRGRRFPWGDLIAHSNANYRSLDQHIYTYDVSSTTNYHPTYAVDGWPYTAPVGSFDPNGYGLYDVAGNAYEWCWDWYSANYYSSSPSEDPRGPDEPPPSGTNRVMRGGAWHVLGAHMLRCSHRTFNVPWERTDNRSLRCVRKGR